MIARAGHRPRWSLSTWLLVSHLAVGLTAVAILLLTGLHDHDLRWQTREALRGQAHVWALGLGAEVERSGDALAAVAERAAPRLSDARERTLVGLQIVDADANVVASAREGRDAWLGDAPEVREALRGGIGEHARPRPDGSMRRAAQLSGPSRLGDVRLFVAVPIVAHGRVVGAVVASRTPRAQVQALVQLGSPLAWRLALISAVACVVALGAGVLGGRSLRRLVRGAARIVRGDPRPTSLRRVAGSRVAEVAAVAEAVEGMAARLRTRLDGAQAFAGHAAHELRTPIATLRGTLELLQDDPAMPAAQRERFLQTGVAELDRLDALVGSLLVLGRGDLPRQVVDLDAILHDAAAAWSVGLGGACGSVLGCASSLRVVVDNLLANARRHGGATIRLQAFATADGVGFAVEDDGPGIDPSVRARMFDRFFTTDRSRGIGLGLAVVDTLVTAHGGRITVRSAPGETRFVVTLPAASGPPVRASRFGRTG